MPDSSTTESRRALREKAARWNVKLEDVRETPSSLIGFGLCDARRVVLKLTRNAGDESRSGEVLQAFGPSVAVRVYESELGAVLLERLDPGEELVNVVRCGDDDEATRILANVIKKLAVQRDDTLLPAGISTVEHWGRAFDWHAQTGDQQLPADLVHEGHELFRDLASSQRATMLLHGDLQHYNVLYDRERGWTMIDPKGVIGELEYEIGALMRNPIELPELFTSRRTIERRLEILTSVLPLDTLRTLRWSFAQAVLSLIWGVEDGCDMKPDHHGLRLARTLRPLLQL